MTSITKQRILLILAVATVAAALLYAVAVGSRKPAAIAGQAFRNAQALCDAPTVTYEVQADGQSLEYTMRCAAKDVSP